MAKTITITIKIPEDVNTEHLQQSMLHAAAFSDNVTSEEYSFMKEVLSDILKNS